MAKMGLKTLAAWVLCVVVGAFFLMSAFPKLMQKPEMVEAFEGWGYSTGFLVLIGVLEGLGGLMMFVPRLATWGAGLLVVVMLGAIYTHLSSGIGSPTFAIVALLLAAVAGALRKDQAIGLRKP